MLAASLQGREPTRVLAIGCHPDDIEIGCGGTILELTDAQLALTQAQNTEAQALSDYQKDLASLDRAVGRR